MAILLSEAFLREVKNKGVNTPNVIVEIALDSGIRKYGYHDGGFADVEAVLGSVSSFQNKLDPSKGFSTRGQLEVTIKGREHFEDLIRDEYLKNRGLIRRDGFVAPGFAYNDYAGPTFSGKIVGWRRDGDELTLTAVDDLGGASKKIPRANAQRTQNLVYQSMNPVDIMKDIIENQVGLPPSNIDFVTFDNERDNWISGWVFERVLTASRPVNEYLNELQIETNSYIYHDGERVSFKVFSPPLPSQVVEEWGDSVINDVKVDSGYGRRFFNRVEVHYDYDESGGNGEENFESAVISEDVDSVSSGQWNEESTKVIKSKWLRSFTYSQPVNISGVTIYNSSVTNGAGEGALTFIYDAIDGEHSLQWSSPIGTVGEAVKVTKDGKFQLFDSSNSRYIRVLVDAALLPISNKSDTITIKAIPGLRQAGTLAKRILSLYRDPLSSMIFTVDINNGVNGTEFLKPTDLKDITTVDAGVMGVKTFLKERMMLTSVRPDFGRGNITLEAAQTRLYGRYGFIAPASLTEEWDGASDSEKEYAFIGNINNELGVGLESGFKIF